MSVSLPIPLNESYDPYLYGGRGVSAFRHEHAYLQSLTTTREYLDSGMDFDVDVEGRPQQKGMTIQSHGEEYFSWPSADISQSPNFATTLGLSPEENNTSSESSKSPSTASFLDFNDRETSRNHSWLFADKSIMSNMVHSPNASLEDWLVRQASSEMIHE